MTPMERMQWYQARKARVIGRLREIEVAVKAVRADYDVSLADQLGAVLVEHPGHNRGCEDDGWTLDQIRAIAEALGVNRIDVASKLDLFDAEGPVAYLAGGCGSCGKGDLLIVRGVLDEGAA
jgi:hypothetical protein